MPRGISIALIVMACVLIAVGRRRVRSAWREMADGARWRARRRRLTGWLLVVLGGAVMVAGVLAW